MEGLGKGVGVSDLSDQLFREFGGPREGLGPSAGPGGGGWWSGRSWSRLLGCLLLGGPLGTAAGLA